MAAVTTMSVKVVAVFPDRGPRVYRLKPAPTARVAFVNLGFGEFPNEKLYFFKMKNDGTVDANVHNCPDLNDLGDDVFYAWQGRLPRLPTTCPRCKTRLDRVNTRGA